MYETIRKWLPSHLRSKNPGPDDCLDLQIETDKGPRDLRMRCSNSMGVKQLMKDLRDTVEVRPAFQLSRVLRHQPASAAALSCRVVVGRVSCPSWPQGLGTWQWGMGVFGKRVGLAAADCSLRRTREGHRVWANRADAFGGPPRQLCCCSKPAGHNARDRRQAD